jgi:hypothetical protein
VSEPPEKDISKHVSVLKDYYHRWRPNFMKPDQFQREVKFIFFCHFHTAIHNCLVVMTVLYINLIYTLLLFHPTQHFRSLQRCHDIVLSFWWNQSLMGQAMARNKLGTRLPSWSHPRSQGLTAARDLHGPWDTRNRKCKKTCSSF